MTANPYKDSGFLADDLWEAEMVADKYFNGGLILIRTNKGWRAFLGKLKEDYLTNLEAALDKNVPDYEKAVFMGQKPVIERMPTLREEFGRLLPAIMNIVDGYYPGKFVDENEETG